MGIAVPVIKMEKDQFEMSPLRDDFSIDFPGDQPKYLADDGAAIKIEPDIDLDLCLNESLEGLMENYTFENDMDVKPDIKSQERDFSPTTSPNQHSANVVSVSQIPAVPTGQYNNLLLQVVKLDSTPCCHSCKCLLFYDYSHFSLYSV